MSKPSSRNVRTHALAPGRRAATSPSRRRAPARSPPSAAARAESAAASNRRRRSSRRGPQVGEQRLATRRAGPRPDAARASSSVALGPGRDVLEQVRGPLDVARLQPAAGTRPGRAPRPGSRRAPRRPVAPHPQQAGDGLVAASPRAHSTRASSTSPSVAIATWPSRSAASMCGASTSMARSSSSRSRCTSARVTRAPIIARRAPRPYSAPSDERLVGQLGARPQPPVAGLGPGLGAQRAHQVTGQAGTLAAHDRRPAADAGPVVEQGVGPGQCRRAGSPTARGRRSPGRGAATARSTSARRSQALSPSAMAVSGSPRMAAMRRLGDVVVQARPSAASAAGADRARARSITRLPPRSRPTGRRPGSAGAGARGWRRRTHSGNRSSHARTVSWRPGRAGRAGGGVSRSNAASSSPASSRWSMARSGWPCVDEPPAARSWPCALDARAGSPAARAAGAARTGGGSGTTRARRRAGRGTGSRPRRGAAGPPASAAR